jgi:N-acetylmuramoyl-L-alanine amidase
MVILALCICGITAQENKITVKYNKSESVVTSYSKNNIVYIPLKKFMEGLSVKTYVEDNKVFVPGKNKKAIFSLNNPFVIVTDQSSNDSVIYQLPTLPIAYEKALYIPLEYSTGYIEKILGLKITFNKKTRVITAVEKKENSPLKSTTTVSGKNITITGIDYDAKLNGTLIKLTITKKAGAYKSSYKNGVFTLQIKEAIADKAALEKKAAGGLVKKVKVENTDGMCTLKFQIDTVNYSKGEIIEDPDSFDMIITLHNKKFSKKTTQNNAKKDKWTFDTIVLDAGHGGKDFGAIGVGGIREKDINLDVVLKLGKIIKENMPDVKVVYTRSNDTFIELYKRGKIANEHGGKLFISIHCNSTPEKPSNAEGFEIYLLRPGRTQEAIKIAERENSVIKLESDQHKYQKLTDENFILVSMAHSAYMKYSEKFSDVTNKRMGAGMKVCSRGVKQAGFYVLVGASMPSVLIELGFLSNKKDESYLASKNGQQKIAESIFKGVQDFRQFYDEQIESD